MTHWMNYNFGKTVLQHFQSKEIQRIINKMVNEYESKISTCT